MKPIISIVSTLLLVSGNLMASNIVYECSHGSSLRVIEVAYQNEGKLPCQVNYTKGGNTETLWRASNQAGYCESKAAEFSDKQSGWGWDCKQVSVTSEPKVMVSDAKPENGQN